MNKLIFIFLLINKNKAQGTFIFFFLLNFNASVIIWQVVKWELRSAEADKSCCKIRCVRNFSVWFVEGEGCRVLEIGQVKLHPLKCTSMVQHPEEALICLCWNKRKANLSTRNRGTKAYIKGLSNLNRSHIRVWVSMFWPEEILDSSELYATCSLSQPEFLQLLQNQHWCAFWFQSWLNVQHTLFYCTDMFYLYFLRYPKKP